MTAMKRGSHHRLPDSLTEREEEMALSKRREYMRQYMAERYRKNPELQKKANIRYWYKRALKEGGGQNGELQPET